MKKQAEGYLFEPSVNLFRWVFPLLESGRLAEGAAIIRSMADALEELPLFPLNTVLFPYAQLQLHIFEARYREGSV